MPDLVDRELREDDEDFEEDEDHGKQGADPTLIHAQETRDADDPEEQGAQEAVPRYNFRTRTNPKNNIFFPERHGRTTQ